MVDKYDAIIRKLKRRGWRVEVTRAGHRKLFPPDPAQPFVVCPGSPGDHRAWKNFRARLRRMGEDV